MCRMGGRVNKLVWISCGKYRWEDWWKISVENLTNGNGNGAQSPMLSNSVEKRAKDAIGR